MQAKLIMSNVFAMALNEKPLPMPIAFLEIIKNIIIHSLSHMKYFSYFPDINK
jgi:hypothetical protein